MKKSFYQEVRFRAVTDKRADVRWNRKTQKRRIMMDTELGELIRISIAIIVMSAIIYIMGDYHSRIKEYLRNRKQKKNELERTKKEN